MYCLESMIDLGLKNGQTFPSEEHKDVAMTLGLCNPRVTDRTTLTEIVQAVCKVPAERIKTITLDEIIKEFDCPNCFY
jgi:hypothetical protein